MREALGEFATIALVPLFELDEVADTNASVTTNAVEEDLAAIEQLVEVSTAHAETLGGLGWGESQIVVDNDDFIARSYAAAQAQEKVT